VSFLGLVVLLTALVPLLTGGSYRRLADAPWRWGGLLALGLGLQLLLDTSIIPRSSWHNVGFGVLVASYVILVGFCAGNLLVRGMAVVLIGVALNGFVVTIDQGMPVRIPPDWQHGRNAVSATVKHHPREPGDHLLALTDIIVLRRLDAIISFGDLIMAFGLVDTAYWASRRARRSRAQSATRLHDLAPGVPVAAAPAPSPARAGAGRRAEVAAGRQRTNGATATPGRQPVGAGIGREPPPDRSEPARTPHPTVAIQDALQRFQRP
jgi:hypothetical protein